MDDQSQLDNFSLEGDQVALPKGAWAQSHRLNVRWRGKDLTAMSQGLFGPICSRSIRRPALP